METKKYIVFKDGTVKIFDRTSIHAFMTGGKEVLSAGFVNFENGVAVKTWGGSPTIGVKSREEDLTLLNK